MSLTGDWFLELQEPLSDDEMQAMIDDWYLYELNNDDNVYCPPVQTITSFDDLPF